MPTYGANGTRLAKAGVAKTAVTDPDPYVQITDIVYDDQPLAGSDSPGRKVKWHAGQKVRTSAFDKAFPTPVITGITPATGLAAGGTVVTIKGTDLDMVTSVTFGGTAGTALKVTKTQIKVTTPAHAAGAVTVVGVADSTNASQPNGFTYS